jgi:tetratricopeptide (TPR) repeat protein
MLYDEVKAVRIEAAVRLAGEAARQLTPDNFAVYEKGLREYIESMSYSGDFTFGRFNLGNLRMALGQFQRAIQHYRAAINIDDQSYPVKVNLAMLYNQLGQRSEAETLLHEVVVAHPDAYDVAYSLALLLAEMGNYNEAALYFDKAVGGLPDHSRIHYNYGLLLNHLRRFDGAERELQRARQLEPSNLDFLYALADFYVKRGRLAEARLIAQEMIDRHPNQRIGFDLLDQINKKP